ncbi:MAG TPA: hypothetical protein DEO93_10035 [Stenotrophomonas sp.]|nr:hypothetical protein [Stenotrophomonas sp.]
MIRNSTAEFLIFTRQAGEASIEARYEDETVWLSQKLMGELFGVDVRTVSEHLQNIFASQELGPEGTIRKFRIVQKEGSRETEFEKYRIVQDRLFESDFDKEVKELAAGAGDVAGGA